MDLFLLPKDIRCRIVCILLGAVKLDKDSKEVKRLHKCEPILNQLLTRFTPETHRLLSFPNKSLVQSKKSFSLYNLFINLFLSS